VTVELHCPDEERRGLIRGKGINAIEFLEVLPGQRTLLVHCLGTFGALDAQNVVITGGVRVRGVEAVWAGSASTVDLDTLDERERPRIEEMPFGEREQTLLVRVDRAGDFSTYTLSLVASRAAHDRPPDGFDPILSTAAFSFKVDCASPFDCGHEPTCELPRLGSPPIDYLAKDYSSFRRLVLDRMSVVMPDWRERNPADQLVALVELLAFAGDRLSYYQDAVATEAYLGTARLRSSVRRHVRMLDYAMHDGANARTWVCVKVKRGSDGALLEPETPVLTGELDAEPALERLDVPAALSRGAVGFETLERTRLRWSHNRIELHTWGDANCCLPRGAMTATLRQKAEDGPLLLKAGDLLAFEEELGAESGVAADADPAHRHVVRLLTDPRPVKDPAEPAVQLVDVRWHADDALPFPLCLRMHDAGPTSVACGNVVLADHGSRVVNERLPEPVSGRRYRPPLQRSSLTHAVAHDPQPARGLSATATLRSDPRTALPWIHVLGEGERWEPERELLGSNRFARSFVAEMEDDGRARLRFGDDVQGRAPTAGEFFAATYRIGNGRAGNVGADALARVAPATAIGIDKVWNPLPATGGEDPEPTEQVRLFAPQAFRSQRRAVTPDDYARMAERHPEVQRAGATRRWTGSWHTIFITIDRVGGRPIDAAFETELRAFLDPFRLAGHDIEIDGPHDVALELELTVCARAGYVRANVEEAVVDALSSRRLPGGRIGHFHPDRFTFGQTVHLSPIVAAVMAVPGVEWVDPVAFHPLGQPQGDELDEGRITLGRLEIARLDNDPNEPEHGRLVLHMGGGV
jgi:hypothetical protein